jgi:hypothetical protein
VLSTRIDNVPNVQLDCGARIISHPPHLARKKLYLSTLYSLSYCSSQPLSQRVLARPVPTPCAQLRTGNQWFLATRKTRSVVCTFLLACVQWSRVPMCEKVWSLAASSVRLTSSKQGVNKLVVLCGVGCAGCICKHSLNPEHKSWPSHEQRGRWRNATFHLSPNKQDRMRFNHRLIAIRVCSCTRSLQISALVAAVLEDDMGVPKERFCKCFVTLPPFQQLSVSLSLSLSFFLSLCSPYKQLEEVQIMIRIGQKCTHTPHMTLYLIKFLPRMPYVHRNRCIWFWPILTVMYILVKHL